MQLGFWGMPSFFLVQGALCLSDGTLQTTTFSKIVVEIRLPTGISFLNVRRGSLGVTDSRTNC